MSLRIRVCTQYDTPFKGVADITIPVLMEYCARHGYDLRTDFNRPIQRSIVWDRYAILAEEIERGDADWVVHMDADVLVTNLHFNLEVLTSDWAHMVIANCSKGDGSREPNDGVLMVRCSDVGKEMVDAIWATPSSDEIQCGQDVISFNFEPDEPIMLAKQKVINSYLFEEYGMPPSTPGQWTPGDFVLHLPGRTNERRVELFTEYSKYILR